MTYESPAPSETPSPKGYGGWQESNEYRQKEEKREEKEKVIIKYVDRDSGKVVTTKEQSSYDIPAPPSSPTEEYETPEQLKYDEKHGEKVKVVYVKCDEKKKEEYKQHYLEEATKAPEPEPHSDLKKLFGATYNLEEGVKEIEESPIMDGEKKEVKATLSKIGASAYGEDKLKSSDSIAAQELQEGGVAPKSKVAQMFENSMSSITKLMSVSHASLDAANDWLDGKDDKDVKLKAEKKTVAEATKHDDDGDDDLPNVYNQEAELASDASHGLYNHHHRHHEYSFGRYKSLTRSLYHHSALAHEFLESAKSLHHYSAHGTSFADLHLKSHYGHVHANSDIEKAAESDGWKL